VKPLPLNLASRPFRNNALVGTFLTVVGLGLVFGTAYNLYVYLSYGASYATLQHAQAEDRARIIELQKQERALADEIKKRDFRSVYNRGKLASELIRMSAFSWTQLFNTLETVVPPNVVLAAIRPNITSDGIVLRVEGVAKDHGALLTLEEKLQQHEAFKRVAPISARRLNPNLPDITFLVTCDYIPPQPAAPAVTASNDGAAGSSDPVGGPKAGADPDAAGGTKGPAPKAGTVTAGGVVGRDGRPKAAGESVIAPGGLLVAQAIAAPAPGTGSAKKGAAAPSSAPAPATKTTGTRGGTTPGAKMVANATAGTPQKTASVPVPAPPRNFGRTYDPNDPRTMPGSLQATATRPKPGLPPVAAERLDMPMTFVGRPAGEVYRSLAAAHGVRIDLDPTVDPATPVTVDLKGRRLEEALMALAGLLHTRTTHPAEGVYRIVSTEVRAPNGDAPPTEEPVVEEAH
jgi:Tfp pilus assembly protein PilN